MIDIQRNLGSDIMMPLDICTLTQALNSKWKRIWPLRTGGKQKRLSIGSKVPIINFYLAWFRWVFGFSPKSAETLTQYDFSGFSIGGLSVGEPMDELEAITDYTTPLLPENKPRYLMGVGLPDNFEAAIRSGIDMFDCVAPTRLARHGNLQQTGVKIFEIASFKMI